jgi:L-asparaginase
MGNFANSGAGALETSVPPLVMVLSLGGTIACIDRGDGRGAQPTMGAADLTRSAPGLERIARIETASPFTLSSAELTLAHRVALAATLAATEGLAGAIVTQGTDTLEDTAFALDLLGAADRFPVVVTGAMRNASLPGADGPVNLLDAARLAVAPQSRGKGVLVVMEGVVHGARFARKVHTRRVGGFGSRPFGPLGWVGEVEPTLVAGPPRPDPLPRVAADVPLPVVRALPGDDPDLLDLVTAAPLDGLVLEGVGGGHLPVTVADRVAALADRIPVVVSTRVDDGGTLCRTYGYPGSEMDLMARGAIMGGWLPTAKARTLLTLGLRAGLDREALEAAFAAYSLG